MAKRANIYSRLIRTSNHKRRPTECRNANGSPVSRSTCNRAEAVAAKEQAEQIETARRSVSWISTSARHLQMSPVAVAILAIATVAQVVAANLLLQASGNLYAPPPTGGPLYSTGLPPSTNNGHLLDRCPSGAPPQWRPFLDAPSKAHLAPCVVFATLRQINITTIQLASMAGGPSSAAHLRQAPANTFNPQNVNQVGVNIETTFEISRVLKNSIRQLSLRMSQTVRLMFRVSGSLATTNALMNLTDASANNNHNNNNFATISPQQAQYASEWMTPVAPAPSCAFELANEEELFGARKSDSPSLFRTGKEYVLFLDQSTTSGSGMQSPVAGVRNQWQYELAAPSRSSRHQRQQQQMDLQQSSRHLTQQQLSSSVHAFVAHEPLSTATSRAIYKILCKGCGKFRIAISC